MQMHRCSSCGEHKPTELFSRDRRHQTGLALHCRECLSWIKRKKAYGVTKESFAALLASQGGACAICSTYEPIVHGGRTWNIDHDHANGVVRGILCHRCNLLLGHAKDDINSLQRAIDYLRKPNAHSPRDSR